MCPGHSSSSDASKTIAPSGPTKAVPFRFATDARAGPAPAPVPESEQKAPQVHCGPCSLRMLRSRVSVVSNRPLGFWVFPCLCCAGIREVGGGCHRAAEDAHRREGASGAICGAGIAAVFSRFVMMTTRPRSFRRGRPKAPLCLRPRGETQRSCQTPSMLE